MISGVAMTERGCRTKHVGIVPVTVIAPRVGEDQTLPGPPDVVHDDDREHVGLRQRRSVVDLDRDLVSRPLGMHPGCAVVLQHQPAPLGSGVLDRDRQQLLQQPLQLHLAGQDAGRLHDGDEVDAAGLGQGGGFRRAGRGQAAQVQRGAGHRSGARGRRPSPWRPSGRTRAGPRPGRPRRPRACPRSSQNLAHSSLASAWCWSMAVLSAYPMACSYRSSAASGRPEIRSISADSSSDWQRKFSGQFSARIASDRRAASISSR